MKRIAGQPIRQFPSSVRRRCGALQPFAPAATTPRTWAGICVLVLGGFGLELSAHARPVTMTPNAMAPSATASNDPCGMVPPIYTGPGNPISRVGLQQTYVFYKDGIETIAIRPGFTGKVDNFGMLIPFPSPPALRKIPDNSFEQIANAVDPPEVVIDLRVMRLGFGGGGGGEFAPAMNFAAQADEKEEQVVVVKQEAVGMYEVAVLEAGSSRALKRWMEEHDFIFPEGMDGVCDEYVEAGWCFVAVKAKVNQKQGVEPRGGQQQVQPDLPQGSMFDGHVQGMGFRFATDELVVPMRLSAFNEGSLRNVVYLLSDQPRKIRYIPEEFVQRQVTGDQLLANLTQPLPLRIIGGTEADLNDWQKENLPQQRDPNPRNGVAKRVFASDLLAVSSGEMSLEHEEFEKELLRIGEHFGLRGNDIDQANQAAFQKEADAAVAESLRDLSDMTLTVIDGDFPREVLASRNLKFAEYQMSPRRNNNKNYDPKTNQPGAQREGKLIIGAVDWSKIESPAQPIPSTTPQPTRWAIRSWMQPVGTAFLFVACLGLTRVRRRNGRQGLAAAGLTWVLALVSMALWFAGSGTAYANLAAGHTNTTHTEGSTDPCGMVPPHLHGARQSDLAGGLATDLCLLQRRHRDVCHPARIYRPGRRIRHADPLPFATRFAKSP